MRLISSTSTTFAKIGTGLEAELVAALVVDADPRDVGGQQVGRRLDAVEVTADRAGERARQHRLPHPGHTLQQQVALGEQADGRGLHHHRVARDDPLDVLDESTEGSGGLTHEGLGKAHH